MLMGMDVGVANAQGIYPGGTINRLVVNRLEALHKIQKKLASDDKTK